MSCNAAILDSSYEDYGQLEIVLFRKEAMGALIATHFFSADPFSELVILNLILVMSTRARKSCKCTYM